MHSIETKGYEVANGDKSLDLVGFDVDRSVPGELHFWLIDQRPAVDVQKIFLDASKVGANVTVDVFRVPPSLLYANRPRREKRAQ